MDFKSAFQLVRAWSDQENEHLQLGSAFRLAEAIQQATQKKKPGTKGIIQSSRDPLHFSDSGPLLLAKLQELALRFTDASDCLKTLNAPNQDRHIQAIKHLRAHTDWGLKETKDACDRMREVIRGVLKAEENPLGGEHHGD